MRPETSSNMSQVSSRPFSFPMHDQPGSSYHQRFGGYPSSRDRRSPGTSLSQLADRQYERSSSWSLPSPTRLSMAEEQRRGGAASPQVAEDHQSRPAIPHRPSREQLPSLSSLFGNSHSNRPAHAPYPDRQSPVFSTPSLQEPRAPATPIHPDRAYEGAYQRPPTSSLYSYSSRSDHGERAHFGPPSRSGPSEGRYSSLDSNRHSSVSTNGWSPSESTRTEYFPRDTSSSFRNHSELPRPKPQLSDVERSPVYRETAHNAPLTPASTISSEPATTKDGLGPKIWTGTQFLPRFVRQAEVPGEGMCYFYDDNTHCKTIIDGEVVNAHWGVTKAGKPRKRLAIACITCREKKIKCDPDYPRCIQCEKFGRVCKFKNAPRGGHGSPDTPPADAEDVILRPSSSRTDAEHFDVEKRESSQSVSPPQTLRRPSPDLESHLSKRQKNAYNVFTPVPSESSPRVSLRETTSPSHHWTEPPISRPSEQDRHRASQTLPAPPSSTVVPDLLALFFHNIDQLGYSMFPKNMFTSWVLSGAEKSQDEFMLINAILAVGTIFYSNPEYKSTGLGAEYATMARKACNSQSLGIHLVQTRLLLAVYYSAVGLPNDAWDLCGAATRAAHGLKMNMELGPTDASAQFPFGLSRSGYAECRRRTFWSCYIMDRLDSFTSGRSSAIRPEEVFLRLPCSTESYESQVEVQTPFFDMSEPSPSGAQCVGAMGRLIGVCTIWEDVMSDIYRSSYGKAPPSRQFETFYRSNMGRLRTWSEQLPSDMTLSPESITKAASSGTLGVLMTVHAVHLTANMKLNRYARTSSQPGENIQLAMQHAARLLDMIKWAGAREVDVSSPFLSYAIVSAVDILTARPSSSTLPHLLASISETEAVLGPLARFWPISKQQQMSVQQRLRDVAEISAFLETTTTTSSSGAEAAQRLKGLYTTATTSGFQMAEPLEKDSVNWKELDLVYS
ncbi:fungal specific transcription factor [Phlyctema vagabunda]|uniref:Fungal specific transcription factor n=1 Tax=Phlyctema vagabunda TaxID=108571 RepID=A0ABR4PI11_9HELO